jgi:hypothetical protein
VTHNLETLIRQYIILGKRSPKGYEIVKCSSCNDYKNRAGFKFEDDSVHYSCFNCGLSIGHNITKDKHSINKKFKDVLLAFGVPEDEIIKTVNLNFFKEKKEVKDEAKKPTGMELPTKEINLPSRSVLISSGSSPWCDVAKQYLAGRALKPEDHNWYVTDETSYAGRLLIPYFFKGKIIYWQGRSMDETIQPRYKNPSIEKSNIFFNMDELYRYTSDPLFVTEGPLDAVSLGKNAVALLGSTLTEFKRNELKKAAQRRKIIFIIDKNANGKKLGNEILRDENLEMYVAVFPDNIEDANDALQKLGRLWMISHLATTAAKSFQGKLMLEQYCSRT